MVYEKDHILSIVEYIENLDASSATGFSTKIENKPATSKLTTNTLR